MMFYGALTILVTLIAWVAGAPLWFVIPAFLLGAWFMIMDQNV